MKKILLLVLATTLLSACTVGKNGSHTGYVTAVEQRGLIWKNYRVYVKTDRSSSQEDVYCIQEDNDDLADKLKEFEKNKQQITVKYSRFVYLFPMARCEGDVIDSFEVIN